MSSSSLVVVESGGHQNIDDKAASPSVSIISPVPSTPPTPRIVPTPPPPPPDFQENNQKMYKSLAICDTAIKVENVCKSYDKELPPVLTNCNMTVPKGTIYSLLGSSGCGKTSLLNLIVGRKSWDSGTVSILGSRPKRYANVIDCRKIGYMPQDLSLQERLTIKELLLLYGRLCGMSVADILTRYQFLQNFLQLPNDEKVLAHLSGGQQRRASLAVALLHEPDLIILDEPTVGLDPLLRQSIWEHLQDLVANLQVTIVLTTHYVDEARRSHVIGLMRHGRIIAEESPQVLMRQYDSTSLDQIVLRICKRDAAENASSRKESIFGKGQIMSEVIISSTPTSSPNDNPRQVFYAKGKLAKVHGEQQVMDDEENGNIKFLKFSNTNTGHHHHHGAMSDITYTQESHQRCFASTLAKGLMGSVKARRECVSRSFTMLRRIKGLIWATYLATFRHPAFVPLTFILPAVTAALVQFVFGSDLHDLKFGYVINDEPFNSTSFANETLTKANCFNSKFSHLFLSKINSDALILLPYPNKSDALKAVQDGDIWGFVNIPANYSFHMQNRMVARQFSNPETIDGTIIGINLDMSSFLGSILVIQKLSDAYQTFLRELATSCGLPAEEYEIPLRYDTPVYGDLNGSYAEHVVPGLILVLIFVLPLGACSVSVIQERNMGCLDRMRVSGMSNWDIIITYFITHGSFQMVQMTLCTLVLVLGFSYVINGPILLFILLNVCNSACGLAFGFFLGLVCATELQALISVFFIASFLLPFSGCFWPVECLQYYWRVLAYCLPTTLVSQSFRSVVFRGLSYTHNLVWPGLVIPLGWMCAFLALALFVLRRY